MAVFRYGRPITIGTQGILRPDTPLTIGVQGFLEPVGVSAEPDLVFGGSAPVSFSQAYVSTGIIITGGTAPIIVTTGGQLIYDYEPSAYDTIIISGDALVVTSLDGKLTYEYTTFGGIQTGGVADTVYEEAPSYVGSGGMVFGGEADTSYKGAKKERGGKGTPAPRKKAKEPQRHVFVYTADAIRDRQYIDTDFGRIQKGRAVLEFTGEADSLFIPSRYQFIKTLPKIQKPELIRDSEFRKIYDQLTKKAPATQYHYSADGGFTITGEAEDSYFDFTNFIITHDDDLIIADILSSDENPFITTSYEMKLSKQRKEEDNDLLEILELI